MNRLETGLRQGAGWQREVGVGVERLLRSIHLNGVRVGVLKSCITGLLQWFYAMGTHMYA